MDLQVNASVQFKLMDRNRKPGATPRAFLVRPFDKNRGNYPLYHRHQDRSGTVSTAHASNSDQRFSKTFYGNKSVPAESQNSSELHPETEAVTRTSSDGQTTGHDSRSGSQSRRYGPFGSPSGSPSRKSKLSKLGTIKFGEAKSSQKYMLCGRVVLVNKAETFGFLEPKCKLPSEYPADENVRFDPRFVKSCGLGVKIGDVLEFTLGCKDVTKPMAFRVNLLRAGHRTCEEILSFINRISLSENEGNGRTENEIGISVDDQIGDDKTGERGFFLIDVLTCTALWDAIGNCQMDFPTTARVVQFVLDVHAKAKSMQQYFKNIISSLSATFMFHRWRGALRLYIIDAVRCKNEIELVIIRKFLMLVLQYVPERAHTVLSLIKPMISKSTDSLDSFMFAALREVAKHNCDDTEDMEWSDLPLVPSSKELTNDFELFYANLKPAIAKGEYESSFEYMDTYFRLLRADCFGSLCKGVQKLLDGKLDHRDMNVYNSVRMAGVSINSNDSGLVIMLQVTPFIHVTNWATTSKLMFGNLLCISPSGTFKDHIWASVVKRDVELLKSKQCILVELCSSHNPVGDAEAVMLMSQARGNMVMVESPTYYLAYRPVLQNLQSMNPEELPFQKELIEAKDADSAESLPKYLNRTISTNSEDMSEELERFYKTVSQHWPTTLDEHQLKAIRHALVRRVACVHGPPGTGKTFIGIALVRSIMTLADRPPGPVLVLTYKNHALDEFLKEMLKCFPGEVVRIGGRSKEPELDACNLMEIKRNIRKGKSIADVYVKKFIEINEIQPEVKKAADNLNRKQILDVDTLLEYLNQTQLHSLLSGCDWKAPQLKKLVRDIEERPIELVETIKMTTSPMSDFFKRGVRRMLLDLALHQWMPGEATVREVEKKYFHITNKTPGFQQDHSSKDADELDSDIDEKDVEDMEQERLAASSCAPIDSSNIILFQNAVIPGFFVGAEEYYSRLPAAQLMSTPDLWNMSLTDRLMLVQCLLVRQAADPIDRFQEVLAHYQQLCTEKKELDEQHKIEIVRSMKVVGMTITGASINASLLAAVRPAIVLVEEAAEVLEPQIIATLGGWVQQLIMIGDHKQLRPQVEDYNLCRNFNFDISMMERLINNNISYETLAKQNRMRPEFAELLHDIYPSLQNADSVYNNKPIACVSKSMYFWDHRDQEKSGRSYSNELEAQRVIKLVVFLIQQGCHPDKITVLAAYQGQTSLLR